MHRFDYLAANFGYPGQVHFLHTLIRVPRYIKMFRRNPPLFSHQEGGNWTPGAELSFNLGVEEVNPFIERFKELLESEGVEGGIEVVM
jgi:hypothetical protein